MIVLSIVLLRPKSFSVSATDGRRLITIIVLPIVLPITLVIIIYLVYKIKSKTNKDKNDENNSEPHIYEYPIDPFQNQENDEGIYTDLRVPGQRDDDHMYGHLNLQPHIYENTTI